MGQEKPSLGQAIDQIINALEPLEPDVRRTAVEAACLHLKIPLAAGGRNKVPEGATIPEETRGQGVLPGSSSGTPPIPRRDIRSFRSEKSPKSAKEMACVVAYYLQELAPEGARKDSVSTSDLEKYFKQANFELPTKLAQVLPDAKGSGYFDSAARGSYKLNAVGYNLVAHRLPANTSAV